MGRWKERGGKRNSWNDLEMSQVEKWKEPLACSTRINLLLPMSAIQPLEKGPILGSLLLSHMIETITTRDPYSINIS